MSNLLHPKFHRRNHHTYGNSANPDAGHDPIASPDSPFRGDFVLSGGLSASAPLSGYAGSFYSSLTGLVVQSPRTALLTRGNVVIEGNLTVSGNTSFATGGGSSPGNITLPVLTSTSEAITITDYYKIGLNIDTRTLAYNNGKLGLQPSITPQNVNASYLFGNGLVSGLDNTGTTRVSANIDNTTIRLVNGKLATDGYQFTDGLASTYDGTKITARVNVDNLTIKVGTGNVLKSGFTFGTGVKLTNDNAIGLNLDNNTLIINANNQLASNLKFPSIGGLLLNNATQEATINVDNLTTRIVNNQLQTFGFISKTDSTPQAVVSNMTFNSMVYPLSGFTFPDGSTLISTKNFIPSVSRLANLKYNYYSGAVVTSDNRIVVWGQNDHFVAGGGGSIWPPQTLKFENDYNLTNNASITKLIHSIFCTAALLSDGSLWVSGYNSGNNGNNGQLGTQKNSINNSNTREYVLSRVSGWSSSYATNSDLAVPVITDFDMACSSAQGYVHLAAIDSLGRLFTWGSNIEGALGQGHFNTNVNRPILVTVSQGLTVKQVGLYINGDSRACTFVITNDGSVYASGYQNDFAQFGDGTSTSTNAFTRCKVASNRFLSNATRLLNSNSSNTQSHYILDSSNNVWAAGCNMSGQLADGTTSSTIDSVIEGGYFKQIPGLPAIKDLGVSGAGLYASICAIGLNGNVYTWGHNAFGQLGIGNTSDALNVSLVSSLNGKGSKVITSNSHGSTSLLGVLGTDGYLYTAGYLSFGQFNSLNTVSTTFNSIPLSKIVEAQICTDTGTSVGIILRDYYNRVFVLCSVPGNNFSGPVDSLARLPFEITNSLV